jgi:hypothetical protein
MTGPRRIGALGVASVLAVLSTVASCGGGSAAPGGGAGTGGAIPGTPVAQCKEVVNTLCKRDHDCNAADAAASDTAMCVAAIDVAFGCDRAKSSFADCLNDLKTVSCSSLASVLQGACSGPLGDIEPSAAQQKCADLGEPVCNWAAACQGVTPTPVDLAQCEQDFISAFDCALAIDETAGYDQCKKDVMTAPCFGGDGGAPDGGGTLSLPACLDQVITYVN